VWLAAYLNALRSVTDEPIRIVAHSHGCNVVKLASMLPELD
jgi:predicted alpha/beta hydrolase family esterase